MKNLDTKKQIKVFKILLILIWMIVIFMFSNEKGAKSTSTSRKVTEAIVQTVSSKSIEENEPIIVSLDKVIRKLAHYTIYTIGGIVIFNYAKTTEKSKKEKILYSIAFGACYAITDEIHQFFVSGRSARIFDVGIDTLGVITGILIYLAIIKIIETTKLKIQE